MGINTVNSSCRRSWSARSRLVLGAIFAAKVGSVFQGSFKILVSIVILVIVIVGGMGRIAGVAAGALVLVGILGGPNQPGCSLNSLSSSSDRRIAHWMMLKRPKA